MALRDEEEIDQLIEKNRDSLVGKKKRPIIDLMVDNEIISEAQVEQPIKKALDLGFRGGK